MEENPSLTREQAKKKAMEEIKKEEVEEIAYHRAGGRSEGRFDRFVRRSYRKRECYH